MNPRGTRGAAVRGRPPGRSGHWPATGALAGALLVSTTLAAACSSSPTANGATATGIAANGAAAEGSSDGGTLAGQLLIQGDQDLVNFTTCMRTHGVQMSDPYHQPGHIGLTVQMPSQDTANRTAFAACNHYMLALVRIKEARTLALAASQLAALTRYAECMRAQDISMLDPNAAGQLNLGAVPGLASSDFGRSSPQFRSADTACQHLLPAGVKDDGSGP